ncbi:MAG: fasciclin domain-containing protein [Bauldia sp.]
MSRSSLLRSVAAAAVGAAFAIAPGSVATYAAEMTVNVGGSPMYPSKNIIENAVNSKDHTTLVAAVKAAGLVDTLEGAGPFTVFAPTNEAFAALPAGTVDGLLKPENKAQLIKVLTYHVVSGRVSAADMMAATMGGKTLTLTTVEGDKLTVENKGGHLWVVGADGNAAEITIADVNQSNGVIQVINKVLLPA